MAAKTGPTPRPGVSTSAANKRIGGVILKPVVIPMPRPLDHWSDDTTAAYLLYVESKVARALEPEDIPAVVALFDYREELYRLMEHTRAERQAGVPPAERLKTIQAIKILDGMISRLCAELGIGPLPRVRLGIQMVEERSKMSKLLAGDDDDDPD